MDPLLEQFLSEGRDALQAIGEQLMQLETRPEDASLVAELFRHVHTLKGNSGLFSFPDMTRVLHAGEDLMAVVRDGKQPFTALTADSLLQAADFVDLLFDEIENHGSYAASHAGVASALADTLRRQIVSSDPAAPELAPGTLALAAEPAPAWGLLNPPFDLAVVPEPQRMAIYQHLCQGGQVFAVQYQPEAECFFQGLDPLHQAMHTPGQLWGQVVAREPWPELALLDAYRCVLGFHLLSDASRDELEEYYRYTPDAITLHALSVEDLILPLAGPSGGPIYEDFIAEAWPLLLQGDAVALQRATDAVLALSSPALWQSGVLRWLRLVIAEEPYNYVRQQALLQCLHPMTLLAANSAANPVQDKAAVVELDIAESTRAEVLRIQQQVLQLPVSDDWHVGRLRAAAHSLRACLPVDSQTQAQLQQALAQAEALRSGQPLLDYLQALSGSAPAAVHTPSPALPEVALPEALPAEPDMSLIKRSDSGGGLSRSLKVDQEKIDHLVNLIGEMVVCKNALPYLAQRAESVYHCRELARELKAQYVVINRIADEMQDAILQVRMLPVSSVFQRFPRLVRDISRRLGKDVRLVLQGEETAADKTIIESLGDPLVHIVRNSLDHGFELPAQRQAAGKPPYGTLTLRAAQEADRVIIDIIDDGAGIDPEVVKRKAYQRGIIDESTLERLSDQAAINLVFAAGFSTAEVVSDLSGRGVGMDVVRSAIEKVNGSIQLQSQKGRGTQLRLSLPLSMAISNVMVIQSDGQLFGVPMDAVVETVRVARRDIHTIKASLTTVLRGRIVPLKALNQLLGMAAPPLCNEDDEFAVLLVRLGGEVAGLLVDDFHATTSVIIKPLSSVLSGLAVYTGSALMGDGSVLMVLNVKELL